MTKRRILYALIVAFVIGTALTYFLFFMPRNHIYHGTLAENEKIYYETYWQEG